MRSIKTVDSWQYRFAFLAGSNAELPADFDLSALKRGFRYALFLPKEEAGWAGRTPSPPRILFLYEDALEIYAHPASGEQPVTIPFAELQFIERGHILLQGWLRFHAACCERNLSYNTRNSQAVRRFLRVLYSAFFNPSLQAGSVKGSLGPPLNLKFQNACAEEWLPGEVVQAQLFRPSKRKFRTFGPLRREEWRPADFVAVTDRRVVWITDRYRDRFEPYGIITCFAPLRSVLGLFCEPVQDGIRLSIKLIGGLTWSIPAPIEMETEIRAFAEAALLR